MPKFIYKAKRGPNDFLEGDLIAENKEDAVVKLETLGLIPIKIELSDESHVKPSEKKDGIIPFRVRAKDIDAFTWQLASLLKANVPMLKAVSLISQQTDNDSFREIVKDLEHQVKNGKMLSIAMKRYPTLFNNLFINMVRSGEEGGVLAEVLYKLAEYREKEQALRRKIQSAMTYPMVMIFVGIATIFIMLTFFMPKLIDIFVNMKQTLPLPTRVLIQISNFTTEKWYWFVIGLFLIYAIFVRVKKDGKKKFLLDLFKLKMPIVKKFVKNAEIAKFCRTLGLLLKNGLSVYNALDLAINTIDNAALREPLLDSSKEIVNQGSTLSSSLMKTKIFPNFVINMISVGEESGRLEESLNEIAFSYEKEVEQGINIMTSLIEPLLILVIGSVVGFIVFALLMPIFDIGMGKGL